MQQHVISTISLMVAAGSAILAIIFFAIYLILRVKNDGSKKQPKPTALNGSEEGTPSVSVDLLAPLASAEPEHREEPAPDHFKMVDTPKEVPVKPEPVPDGPTPLEEDKGEIKLSYEEVMRKYFNE